MPRLFLVRHGESAWNAEGRLQGQAQAPLSDLGREQARALRLPRMLAVCSDLDRARDTAALAGFPDAPTDPRWRERGLGVWEDHLEREVTDRAGMAAFRRGDFVPEGGEPWAAFQSRVVEAAGELEEDHLVFTHGGCVRALVAAITGADYRTVVGPANTSVTVVRTGQRPRMLAFNWTPELPGLEPGSDPGA